MIEDTTSVILTVYNQENIIKDIVWGILNNISSNVKELIFVIDGCTDKSEEKIDNILKYTPEISITKVYTPNVNEVKANNAGLKLSKYKYSILVQDDCKITEMYFDRRMLKPFKLFDNLLAVSGRDAEDWILCESGIKSINLAGRDANTPKDIFSIRSSINRSPLMVDNEKMRQLSYFDEAFAPIWGDDIDLSFRAYKKFGYLVGSYPVDYYSPLEWGTTRKPGHYAKWGESYNKNTRLLIDRHFDILMAHNHDKDIKINE